MENSFDHAKEFAAKFFTEIGHDLNHSTAIRLMTEWASNFSNGEVKEAPKVDLDAITAPLQAKIAEYETLLGQKDTLHQEAVNALQKASAELESLKAEATVVKAVKKPKAE